MAARRRRLEDELEVLRAMREAGPDPARDRAELERILAGRFSHAAGEAAKIAGESEMVELVAPLVEAFDRFMADDPVKRDPGCVAKTEISEALQRLGHEDAELFLRGIRHVQLEPVYGGRVDTAPPLRQAAAYGLVRLRYGDLMAELADLLADPEVAARIGAARALGHAGLPSGLPLLRLKIRIGDADPAVTSECMASVIQIDPEAGVAFVGAFLEGGDPARVEAAALALGGSRRAEALPLLKRFWRDAADDALQATGFLAIAMLRSDEAIDHLADLVGSEPGPTARRVLGALAIYRHDEGLWSRIAQRALAREDVDLRDTLDALG